MRDSGPHRWPELPCALPWPATILPAPGPPLPSFETLELESFWQRFEQRAPFHVRFGFASATFVLGRLLPSFLGQGSNLAMLSAETRDEVLQRAQRLPVLEPFVEVSKLVACMAYFYEDSVQAHFPGRR